VPNVREAAGFTVVNGVENAAQLAKLITVLHSGEEILVLNLVPTLVVFAGDSLLREFDL
jgi:hypothetical protein